MESSTVCPFGTGLFHFSIMYSGFIHVVAYVEFSLLAQATVTKCHRFSGLYNRHLLVESGISKIKVPKGVVLGEDPLLGL